MKWELSPTKGTRHDVGRRCIRQHGKGRAIALVVSALTALIPGAVSASDALATKYACVACHQKEAKTIGPAWQDIRAKYAGKLTPEQLAKSVKAGSSGKWGAMPMPPQTVVPDADLVALTTWILEGAK